MTRSLGGEQSLKAEVFETSDGSQLGHCTIKGRSAATQVYGMFWGASKRSISYADELGQRISVCKAGTGNAFGCH